MAKEKFLKSILLPPEDVDGYNLSGPADVVAKPHLCILHLSLTRFPSQLFCNLNGHGDPCGPEGMAFRFQSPIHVDRNLPPHIGLLCLDQFSTLPLFTETKILISHNLCNGKTVMDRCNM